MTKKDYILIANAIDKAATSNKVYSLTHDYAAVRTVYVNSIADALQTDNPLFDRKRFNDACEKSSLTMP